MVIVVHITSQPLNDTPSTILITYDQNAVNWAVAQSSQIWQNRYLKYKPCTVLRYYFLKTI